MIIVQISTPLMISDLIHHIIRIDTYVIVLILNTFICRYMYQVHVSGDVHVSGTCIRYMYQVHVSGDVHVSGTYIRYMYQVHVSGTCTCIRYMYQVMYMYQVHISGTCTCIRNLGYMYQVHVGVYQNHLTCKHLQKLCMCFENTFQRFCSQYLLVEREDSIFHWL